MIFDRSIYNDDFFSWHLKYARDYSISTMNKFMDKYKPNTVADFGCGIGSYLESAYDKGAVVFGLEIALKGALPYIPERIKIFIHERDICEPFKMVGKYDVVLSLETAEHIEPSGTDTYIENLVNSGEIVVFTGAPESQGGMGHINCKERNEWLRLFESKGAKYNEQMTNEVKELWSEAPVYIRENLLIFNT